MHLGERRHHRRCGQKLKALPDGCPTLRGLRTVCRAPPSEGWESGMSEQHRRAARHVAKIARRFSAGAASHQITASCKDAMANHRVPYGLTFTVISFASAREL